VKEEISEEKNWSELTETDKPDYLKMSDIEAIEESVGASAEGFEDLKVAAERDSEVEVSGDYSFTEPIVVENRTLTIRNSGPTTFRRADGYYGRFFEVKEGGHLIILSGDEEFIFDGEGINPNKGYRSE